MSSGLSFLALLCQVRSTQLMFNKCLLFAAEYGVDDKYGGFPILLSLGLHGSWNLSWVDNFLFTPLVYREKQLYYLNSPRSRM